MNIKNRTLHISVVNCIVIVVHFLLASDLLKPVAARQNHIIFSQYLKNHVIIRILDMCNDCQNIRKISLIKAGFTHLLYKISLNF